MEAVQDGLRKLSTADNLQEVKEFLLRKLVPQAKSLLDSQKVTLIACNHGADVAAAYRQESSTVQLDDKEKKKLDEILKNRKNMPFW